MESEKDNLTQPNTAEYFLSNIFIKDSSQKYLPMIKQDIDILKIENLFSFIFTVSQSNASELYALIDTLYSLFIKHPPLINLLHSNMEKGFIFKQLIQLNISLIDNQQSYEKELFSSICIKLKKLIQLCVNFYDCPRKYYDIVYHKIASMSLWKKEGFDETSFPSETFIKYIELLQALYGVEDTRNHSSRIYPKKYIVMNGNTSITFNSNTVNTISLKNRIFCSWFCIPNYVIEGNESISSESCVFEIFLKSNNSQNKSFGVYINNQNKQIYFKSGDAISYITEVNTIQPGIWYILKYSFTSGIVSLFNDSDSKTHSLSTNQKALDDINIKDITLYRNFYGITTSSFIIELQGQDTSSQIFPGMEEISHEDTRNNKEIKLYNSFCKYGLSQYKLKDYFLNKIHSKQTQFDLFISPFQIYNTNNTFIFEHNETTATFNKLNQTNLNYFNISDYSNDLKRIHLLGGINVLLPLFEIILSSNNNYLQTEQCISSIIELIASVLSKSKYNFIDAIQNKFFYCFGLFLGKIKKTLYDTDIWSKLLWIKKCFEELCETFPQHVKDNISKYNSFYNHLIFNFKLTGKFNIEILSSFLRNIKTNIEQFNDLTSYLTVKNALFSAINLKPLVYYILKHDRKKYKKYCCNYHKNVLLTPNDSLTTTNPSSKDHFSLFKDIIILFILHELNESKLQNIILFIQCLLLDISPCLQEFIISIINELFENHNLNQDNLFIKCLNQINFIDTIVFVLSTSFYLIRIKLIEFVIKHKEVLITISKNESNVIFNDEQMLILSVCLKPILYNSIQLSNDVINEMDQKEKETCFNAEYKEEKRKFSKAHKVDKIEEKNWYVFGDNFCFLNKHPQIVEDLNGNYYQTCISFFKSICPKNKTGWFSSLLLFMSWFDYEVIKNDVISLIEIESNKQLEMDLICADNFPFFILDVGFCRYIKQEKENKYVDLFFGVFKGLCLKYISEAFYQSFLIWFMYRYTIINAIKDEHKEEKETQMKMLFEFFEEVVLKNFLNDFNYKFDSPEKLEVIAYFVSVCYDYIFTLRHNMDLMTTDKEISCLTLSDKYDKVDIFEKKGDRDNCEYSRKMKKEFVFDIPLFLKVNDMHKINAIENLIFPFCKSIMYQLQLSDSFDYKDIETTIKNFVEFIKKTPKKQEATMLINIFGFLFCPPHIIREEKTKCENIIKNFDKNIPETVIDLTKYQFTEVCRVISSSLLYYVKHNPNKKRKLDACKIARDFILYLCGHASRYLINKNQYEVYDPDIETRLNSARNAIFVLFKIILQELYPFDMSNEVTNEEKTKLKLYIASILYFYELMLPHIKFRELSFLFSIFSNIDKNINCPIKINDLVHMKKIKLEPFLNIIQDKNEPILESFWDFLLQSVPYVNEFNEINYFQSNKIVHNARKLIFEIQYVIPIIPVDFNKIDISKLQGLTLHYDNLYIQYKHYNILCNFQTVISDRQDEEMTSLLNYRKQLKYKNKKNLHLYKSIKKELFSFRNTWSNHKLFYEEKDKLKYKIVNHYTAEFSQCLLTPIIDVDLYLPEFRYFAKDKLFKENKRIINLDINYMFSNANSVKKGNEKENEEDKDKEIQTYLSDLYKHFNKTGSLNVPKKNKKRTKYYLCLIKKTNHIRCMLDINKQNKALKIEFIYNQQGTGIDKKDLFYDKDNDTCFGSFIYCYPKDIYKHDLIIPFDELAFYLDRRYFYKDAIEIFTTSNKSFLFHGHLCAITYLKSILLEKVSSLIPIKLKLKDTDTIGYISNSISHKLFNENKCLYFNNILANWKENKISSLNFLLLCNIFGGRSFNDLTQYPVFPWTISNYTSESLNYEKDLRNFEYPMGKIETNDTNRFSMYIKDFEKMSLKKTSNKTPLNDVNENNNKILWEELDNEPYFYGNHYSNPINVSNFLSRIFPFTFTDIEIQGKSLESLRLFSSIPEAFHSATSQKIDVRELVPEFFVLPEIFININNLNINTTNQNVELPKWANNSPYKYIIQNRMSLESDECQEVLHHWFNLIFGYKQTGEESKRAHNVYMNHTYHDKVIIQHELKDKISKDEEIWVYYYLRAAETGLSPRQLLKEENTCKSIKKKDYKMLEKNTIQNDKWFCIEQSMTFDSVLYCYYNNDSNKNIVYVLTKSMKLHKLEITYDKYSMFNNKHIYNLKECIGNNKQYNNIELSNKYIMDSNQRIVSIDYWDQNIYEFDISGKHIKTQKIKCNEDNSLITTFIFGYNNTIAVIGTQKGSLILYKLTIVEDKKRKKKFLKISSKKKYIRIWKYLRIINKHYSEITAISIKEELNLLVSGDKEGYINIYTLPNCKLIRSFKLQTYTKYIFISDSPIPCIVTFANKEFQSFTINGSDIPIDNFEKLLLRIPLKEDENSNEDIKAFCYYRHHTWKEFLIVATTYGHLQLRAFPNMKMLQNIPIIDYKVNNISGLFVLNEKIIVGFTEKGKVYIFSFEN